MTERVAALPAQATIVYLPEVGVVGAVVHAHDVTILPSGWIRVTWLDGSTSHVSPAALRDVRGKGVSYGA